MTFEPEEGGTTRARLRWLLGVAGLLAVPFAVVWWPGCRQYPVVTSRESLQMVRLLYAACNTRDPTRLAQVEQRLEKAARAGQVTSSEVEAFRDIVALARGGDWAGAERASFRFARDQVDMGK